MPQITIKQGRKQVGTPFLFSPVKDPIISIGRHPSNDIKLKDAKRQVSRHHAAVILDSKDRYFAQDLGSMNGISLNGNPVYRKLLKDGDILSVGGFDLVFTEKDVKQAKLMVPIISEDKAGVPIQTERYTDIPTAPHVNESILLTRLTPERQAVFQDIAKRLQFMADRDQILQDILDSVCHAAEADKAYIAMMDESSVLWVSTLFGIDVDRGDQVPGLAQSWIDSVIANEAPYHMQNLQGTGTVIACHPLWAGDGLIGIVFMNRKEGFSQNDLDFITIVLEHARIPIQQASVSGTRQRETTHSDEGLSWKTRLEAIPRQNQ